MFHVEHSNFGVYIHVPFCVSKCGYCDFCRVTDLSLRDAYLDALEKEIAASKIVRMSPRTVYVGGGTPSCLGVAGVSRLLGIVNNYLKTDGVEEWTVECNPEDVNIELARALRSAGVGRVSMGAQSLFDPMLKYMGRRHNARRVYDAIDTLRAAGVDNISVDCIYGLPAVDGYRVEDDFRRFAALDVEHLSAYSLQYEEGSRFSQMADDGRLTPTDDDDVADQYDTLTAILREAGYLHYEISNYARPGREARHNSSYWNRTDYYGFGPAASSFASGVRTTNTRDVREYIASAASAHDLVETLTTEDVFCEVVMLGLRTSRGMAVADVPEEYLPAFLRAADSQRQLGNIIDLPGGRLRIPENRWMISDSIIRQLTVNS